MWLELCINLTLDLYTEHITNRRQWKVLGYVLRAGDQRARASMRVHVSYITATG
jgi:hypothetical protein